MVYYFKAPSGIVDVESVRRATLIRLQFLTEVVQCRRNAAEFRSLTLTPIYVKNCNYLMEGTSLDCMSHFMLSLLLADCRRSIEFLRCAELELLKFRLLENSERDLTKHFKRVSKFVLRCGDDQELSTIFAAFDEYRIHHLIAKWRQNDDSSFIPLPFTSVLHLVSERRVVLRHGRAQVPLNQMRQVFVHIFDKLFKKNVDKMRQIRKSGSVVFDSRLGKLTEELKAFIRISTEGESKSTGVEFVLKANDVDAYAGCFPPCMLNIHRQLRRKHRLKHHARIQYTLFLKDVGISLNESTKFWAGEYSRQSCCTSTSCSHDWNRDGKRYVYNLRHLYGLEGQKISYSGHCCRALQRKIVSFGDDAGCPFRHFDGDKLRKMLSQEYGIFDFELLNNIDQLVSNKLYNCACSKLLLPRNPTELNTQLTSNEQNVKAAQSQTFSLTSQQRMCIEHRHASCSSTIEENNISVHKPSDFFVVKMKSLH